MEELQSKFEAAEREANTNLETLKGKEHEIQKLVSI